MMYSDPKVQQYTEVQFDKSGNLYLRYCDLTFAPNWNMIGIQWYKMVQGTWEPCRFQEKIESIYQRWPKQLSATEST